MEMIITLLKEAGSELIGAIIAAVLAAVALLLRRLADLVAVQGAVTRAEGLAMSAMSKATEGEPVDEGEAISVADDYLRAAVPKSAKRLGADLSSIAMASVVGAIAKAARK
jgi:hypothetical protein